MASFSNKHTTQAIKIREIVVKERRSLKPEKVNELIESINALDQQTPITVRKVQRWGKDEMEFQLVAGWHRLEAMKKMGRETISCGVMEGDARQARLWQISENLHRAELTALEYDEHVAEWVRLIEEDEVQDEHEKGGGIFGQNVRKSARGRPRGGKAEAARKLPVQGKSEEAKRKNVERAIKVADIDAAAKDVAKEAGLDNEHTALLRIAAEKTSEAQLTKARELAARKTDKIKRSSSGRDHRKVQKSDTLSSADKKVLQRLLKVWERQLKGAFAEASATVRRQFVEEIQRIQSASGGRASWVKK